MSDETYLFGAEVNKIQDTLFAASLQRQVVGGSQLLAVFTEDAAQKAVVNYGAKAGDVITKAGGNFRIIFHDFDEAKKFGELIANTYHLLLDGKMTVAKPRKFEDRDKDNCDPTKKQCAQNNKLPCLVCANDLLDDELRDLKRKRPFSTTQPHAPSTAYCTSSGVKLAEGLKPLEAEEEYMSGTAFRMKEVGHVEKKGEKTVAHAEEIDEGFLFKIREFISDTEYKTWGWAKTPEAIAAWDPAQNNVAYLVADGNNMGKYFRHCRTKKDRQELSQALSDAVYKAIAAPIPQLTNRLLDSARADKQDQQRLPLLPLIAAGDDIFVLLPAPYALDYASSFCNAFTNALKNNIFSNKPELDLPKITMSAAVVFCKQSYPYLLAHKYGEHMLKQTKQVVKDVGDPSKDAPEWHSAVSFDMIIGSAGSGGRSFEGPYRPTLRTYWADEHVADRRLQAAIPLRHVLEHRILLHNLPAKRRAELRALFDTPPTSDDKQWNQEFRRLMRRIEKTEPAAYAQLIAALKDLGGGTISKTNPAGWKDVTRVNEAFHAHGLPDLLTVWAYAQTLTEPLGIY